MRFNKQEAFFRQILMWRDWILSNLVISQNASFGITCSRDAIHVATRLLVNKDTAKCAARAWVSKSLPSNHYDCQNVRNAFENSRYGVMNNQFHNPLCVIVILSKIPEFFLPNDFKDRLRDHLT
jgi:hypothetical protein